MLLPARSRSALHILLAAFLLTGVLPCAADDLYRCTRVLDCDTIELETIGKVRLIGVDTPESPPHAVYTRRLVSGKNVRLKYDVERRDLFGRTLAYVYLEDGSFLNAEIIRSGHGKAYLKYPFRLRDEFVALEREAREARRGLWDGSGLRQFTSQVSESEDTVPVYVTRTGSKYHRAGCRYLARSKIPIDLSEAVRSYGPCSVCDPPTLRSATQRPIHSYQNQQPSRTGRCQAITKKGLQCKRNAKDGSSYCWQHGG